MKNFGAIILCGGQSRRMGLTKATLPFGEEIMVQRVVRLLSEVASPLVVVAAMGQELPSLGKDVHIARDARADRGPLEGLAAGLRAIVDGVNAIVDSSSPAASEVNAVYATSCDVPLLVPDFAKRLYQQLRRDDEIVVPRDDQYHHPLAAIYRTSVLPVVEELLRADRLRPVFLYQLARTREVSVESLRDVDPHLDTLQNLNRPEDYFAAMTAAGFAVPAEIARQLGVTGSR